MDKLLIARQQAVTLQLHSPSPREVAIAMEESWEQEDLSSPVVMKDGSRYRMWYSVWHSIGEEERALGLRRRGHIPKGVRYSAYAESKDGIHWHRPVLGLYDFMGSKDNNLVWAGPGAHISVLKDANSGVPDDERYKAVTRSKGAFKGERLWLNYSTSATGWLKVEVQDLAGKPIPGFDLDQSHEIFGDELEREVRWISGSQVGLLQGRPVRLRFRMKDADLFSFRFGDRTSDGSQTGD